MSRGCAPLREDVEAHVEVPDFAVVAERGRPDPAAPGRRRHCRRSPWRWRSWWSASSAPSTATGPGARAPATRRPSTTRAPRRCSPTRTRWSTPTPRRWTARATCSPVVTLPGGAAPAAPPDAHGLPLVRRRRTHRVLASSSPARSWHCRTASWWAAVPERVPLRRRVRRGAPTWSTGTGRARHHLGRGRRAGVRRPARGPALPLRRARGARLAATPPSGCHQGAEPLDTGPADVLLGPVAGRPSALLVHGRPHVAEPHDLAPPRLDRERVGSRFAGECSPATRRWSTPPTRAPPGSTRTCRQRCAACGPPTSTGRSPGPACSSGSPSSSDAATCCSAAPTRPGPVRRDRRAHVVRPGPARGRRVTRSTSSTTSGGPSPPTTAPPGDVRPALPSR